MKSQSLFSTLCIAALAGTLCTNALAQDAAPAAPAAATSENAAAKLTQQDVDKILAQAEETAARTLSGKGLRTTDKEKRTAKFHIFVVDRHGNILGRKSAPDAWVGSVDIALGKARTAAFFSSDENALSSRILGQLSQAHGPDGTGPAGTLWGIGNSNYPGGDGNDDRIKKNVLITFPGGLPLYKDGKLAGGIGVSGDGVDQDEFVAFGGAKGFMPGPEVGVPAPLEPVQVETKDN